jgi:hypothetical protein
MASGAAASNGCAPGSRKRRRWPERPAGQCEPVPGALAGAASRTGAEAIAWLAEQATAEELREFLWLYMASIGLECRMAFRMSRDELVAAAIRCPVGHPLPVVFVRARVETRAKEQAQRAAEQAEGERRQRVLRRLTCDWAAAIALFCAADEIVGQCDEPPARAFLMLRSGTIPSARENLRNALSILRVDIADGGRSLLPHVLQELLLERLVPVPAWTPRGDVLLHRGGAHVRLAAGEWRTHFFPDAPFWPQRDPVHAETDGYRPVRWTADRPALVHPCLAIRAHLAASVVWQTFRCLGAPLPFGVALVVFAFAFADLPGA